MPVRPSFVRQLPRAAARAALGALLSASVACRDRLNAFSAADPTPIHATTTTAAATAVNRFGIDAYGRLRAGRSNVIFSPISTSLALAMTAAGAKGETLAQISRVLHLDDAADAHAAFGDLLASLPQASEFQDPARLAVRIEDVVPGIGPPPPSPPVLRIADRIWTQQGWTYHEDFVSILRDRYRSSVGEVDFFRAPGAARDEINAWVEKQTRRLIQDLLPPGAVDSVTRLVLTNAIYFKASWASPFARPATQDETFATPRGDVRAPMMRQLAHFAYAKLDDGALVEMPYFDSSVSMVVFLPDDKNGLADLEGALGRDYDRWVGSLAQRRVDLWLPRWKVTQSFELDEVLRSLGMPLAFTREADFSGMTDMPTEDPGKVHIDRVLQKAFVDVDEFGTEAAAATAVVMAMATSAMIGPPPPEPVVFHADHPFFYVIRERKTGAILFEGRVVNPLATP